MLWALHAGDAAEAGGVAHSSSSSKTCVEVEHTCVRGYLVKNGSAHTSDSFHLSGCHHRHEEINLELSSFLETMLCAVRI